MAAPRRRGPKSSTYYVQIWLIINYSKPQFLHLHNNNHLLQRFVVKIQQEILETIRAQCLTHKYPVHDSFFLTFLLLPSNTLPTATHPHTLPTLTVVFHILITSSGCWHWTCFFILSCCLSTSLVSNWRCLGDVLPPNVLSISPTTV